MKDESACNHRSTYFLQQFDRTVNHF